MYLLATLVAAGAGSFVVFGIITGKHIPQLDNENDNFNEQQNSEPAKKRSLRSDIANAVTDCSAVECGEHKECFQRRGDNAQCNCSSGFVTLLITTDESREEICRKICENCSDCDPDEVCKDHLESGIYCVDSKSLDSCDGIICVDRAACELVDTSPTCKCPSNELLINIEIPGSPEWQCRQICEESSECETDEVCKHFEHGIVCVDSRDLDSCDGVRCEDRAECQLVEDSPKCLKCLSDEFFMETTTDGTLEKRCRRSCTTTDNCKPGTLCFEDSFSTLVYCEDRERLTTCSNAVRCTSATGCCLSYDLNIDCLCKNQNESTRIELTTAGSSRTCRTPTCADSDGCARTELCLIDKYSKQGYCEVKSNECKPEINCPDSTKCKLDTDGLAECLCETGYTEINQVGLHATTRTCHTQTCVDSSTCGEHGICYQFPTAQNLYCADGTRGCHGAVCPDNTECFNSLTGAKCMCPVGYMDVTESMTDNVATITITCREVTCVTADDCEKNYLCYFNDSLDNKSGICSTQLKGCNGVRCPLSTVGCRESPSALAECLCAEEESTAVESVESGGTIRKCYTNKCKDGDDCGRRALCYMDEASMESYCAVSESGCNGAICSRTTECFDTTRGYGECLCIVGRTYRVDGGRRRSTLHSPRLCQKQSCVTSDDCGDRYLCYDKDPTDKYGGCATRLKGCDGVECPSGTTCKLTKRNVAGCLCDDGKPTEVVAVNKKRTKTKCHTQTCTNSNGCGINELCYLDETSLDLYCAERTKGCKSVVCPDGYHCDTSIGQPQCLCDNDELTQKPRTTEIIPMTDTEGRNISERTCHPSCTNSDDCIPGLICYSDESLIGNLCSGDRTPAEGKCANVVCSLETECSDKYQVADCLCPMNRPTIINRTSTGSERFCSERGCIDQNDCSDTTSTVCLRDPYSFQSGCVDPNVVVGCRNVVCTHSMQCEPIMKSCVCEPDEDRINDRCFKRCEEDIHCTSESLGICEDDKRCEHERSR